MIEVELKYSYVDKEMSILIDNNILEASSRLNRYMSMPFYNWAPRILNDIYDIIGSEFVLYYTGREEEYRILMSLANEIGKKIRIVYKEPVVNMTIQKRMKELGSFLKNNPNLKYSKHQRNILFLGNKEILNKYAEEIRMLQAENSYCKLNFIMSVNGEKASIDLNDILVYMYRNNDDNKFNINEASNNYNIVMEEALINNSICIQNGIYTCSLSKATFFDNMFCFLLLFPLTDVLHDVIEEVVGRNNNINSKQKLFLKSLLKNEPVYDLDVKQEIEVDEFVKWQITVFPEVSYIPNYIFEYSDFGIVKCSNQGIQGLSEGNCCVKLHKKGDLKTLKEFNFHVYKRNRISDIIFLDKELVLGIGKTHKMEVSFVPDNADNMNKILWTSSNPEVATVNQDGLIVGKKLGTCLITCKAEKIVANCRVQCKAHLERIEFRNVENNKIHLIKGEEFILKIKKIPEDSIDGELKIISNDMFVVNASGYKLSAIDCGVTTIIITNLTNTVSRKIRVVVSAKNETIKFNIKNKLLNYLES
mgnify:FL=1